MHASGSSEQFVPCGSRLWCPSRSRKVSPLTLGPFFQQRGRYLSIFVSTERPRSSSALISAAAVIVFDALAACAIVSAVKRASPPSWWRRRKPLPPLPPSVTTPETIDVTVQPADEAAGEQVEVDRLRRGDAGRERRRRCLRACQDRRLRGRGRRRAGRGQAARTGCDCDRESGGERGAAHGDLLVVGRCSHNPLAPCSLRAAVAVGATSASRS